MSQYEVDECWLEIKRRFQRAVKCAALFQAYEENLKPSIDMSRKISKVTYETPLYLRHLLNISFSTLILEMRNLLEPSHGDKLSILKFYELTNLDKNDERNFLIKKTEDFAAEFREKTWGYRNYLSHALRLSLEDSKNVEDIHPVYDCVWELWNKILIYVYPLMGEDFNYDTYVFDQTNEAYEAIEKLMNRITYKVIYEE